MIDFEFDENLDLMIENDRYKINTNGETALLSAILTDERYNDQHGYWLDINDSLFWTFAQKRKSRETIRELKEVAEKVANDMIVDEIFPRVLTDVQKINGMYDVIFNCVSNENEILVSKTIKI